MTTLANLGLPAVLATTVLCVLGEHRSGPRNDGAFRFDPDLVDVGHVLHYRHSNVDGSRASRVALYWAAEDRIESLKWNPGSSESTLVVAEMDWERFCAASFRTTKFARGQPSREIARLETKGNELVAGGGALRCEVELWPWHSYDFDLASLNVALRFRTDPEDVLLFGVADVMQRAGSVEFVFRGEVELAYVEDEEREGRPCRKYTIEGPGFEFRGGQLWAAKDAGGHFVDFEIDLPDEPGMTSGKLTLLEEERMTPEEWERFVAESVE